jgi:hypothetical protein
MDEYKSQNYLAVLPNSWRFVEKPQGHSRNCFYCCIQNEINTNLWPAMGITPGIYDVEIVHKGAVAFNLDLRLANGRHLLLPFVTFCLST